MVQSSVSQIASPVDDFPDGILKPFIGWIKQPFHALLQLFSFIWKFNVYHKVVNDSLLCIFYSARLKKIKLFEPLLTNLHDPLPSQLVVGQPLLVVGQPLLKLLISPASFPHSCCIFPPVNGCWSAKSLVKNKVQIIRWNERLFIFFV